MLSTVVAGALGSLSDHSPYRLVAAGASTTGVAIALYRAYLMLRLSDFESGPVEKLAVRVIDNHLGCRCGRAESREPEAASEFSCGCPREGRVTR